MTILGGYFDLNTTKTEIKALEIEVSEPDFWQDQEKAARVNQYLGQLKEEVETWEKISREVNDLADFTGVAENEGEESVKDDIEEKLAVLIKRFEKLEFFILFNQKYDKNNAILTIHAGAGGVEAQDWAEMLLRMFLRFCEQHGFKAQLVDVSRGGEAGIKSATIDIVGRWAYGWLKSEAGVHRLVRISPFDAEKMRHTSFALVEVLPELAEVAEVEIKEEDLRVDTYRASGHGGQNVNKTDSAVRVTHLPTKITVACQNERSQHQNKETALKILKSRLYQLNLTEKEEEKRKLRGEYSSAEWGNQIRSYVLHPYKMVKDHRTKFESKDSEAVLAGDLEGFVEAFVKKIKEDRQENKKKFGHFAILKKKNKT